MPVLHSRWDSTRQDENESVEIHSSHLLHSWPVLISSQSSQRLVGKSVTIHRKCECLECLASLSMILARECECLHSCILRLVHISPKVSTSTQEENVNQALGQWRHFLQVAFRRSPPCLPITLGSSKKFWKKF